jgi:hypothetical protein
MALLPASLLSKLSIVAKTDETEEEKPTFTGLAKAKTS